MSCPICHNFMKRVKGPESKFEDIDHNYPRVKCTECGSIFFISGSQYYPTLK